MISKAGAVARYVFLDLVGSVIHFPFWWYVTGFFGVLHWVGRSLSFHWRSYGIPLWVKNFFVPMYGQYDFAGRLTSVFMRFFVLLFRLMSFFILSGLYLLAIVAWLAAPLVTIFLFFVSLLNYVRA